MLKNLVCATACVAIVAASPMLAGTLTDPVVAPEVIAAETVDTSGDSTQLIIPLMVLMILVGTGY